MVIGNGKLIWSNTKHSNGPLRGRRFVLDKRIFQSLNMDGVQRIETGPKLLVRKLTKGDWYNEGLSIPPGPHDLLEAILATVIHFGLLDGLCGGKERI